MSRLALVVLLTCLEPARAAAGEAPEAEAPSESEIRRQARDFVQKLCVEVPAACPEARRILDGYASAVESAGACMMEACAPGRLQSIAGGLWKLDEAEHGLPFQDGGDRPLLRLSVLASALLAEAGAASGHPEAATAPGFRPEMEAPKVVEAVCFEEPGSCSMFRGILAEDRRVRAALEACRREPCAFEVLEQFLVRASRSLSVYFSFKSGRSLSLSPLPLFSILNKTNGELASMFSIDVRARMSRLRDGIAAAEAGGGRAFDEGALDELYRKSHIGLAHIANGTLLDAQAKAAHFNEINLLAGRLASLKARRKAGQVAAGLGGLEELPASSVGRRPAGGSAAAAAGRDSPAPYRALDRTAAPAPLRARLPAPDIRAEPNSAFELAKGVFSEDPVVKADALRRLGLTSTVGDPGGLARFAYHQANPSSCGLAAQLQVLRSLSLLPPGDPREQEKVLMEEASRHGFFDDGIPAAYEGNLLVERGVPVTKHAGSTWEQFEAAVLRGNTIMAGVDARFLWNIPSERPLGHAILVTGAELSTLGGGILGVYINDSGGDPPSAGRFVPIAQFRKAWEGLGRDYVEVLQ